MVPNIRESFRLRASYGGQVGVHIPDAVYDDTPFRRRADTISFDARLPAFLPIIDINNNGDEESGDNHFPERIDAQQVGAVSDRGEQG